MITLENFIVVQHMVGALANVCVNITSEETKKLEIENIFNNFLCLFDRLTFTTSTLPIPFSSLERAIQVIISIVKCYEPSRNILLNNPLINKISKMLLAGASLAISGLFDDNLNRILFRTAIIINYCGKTVENVEKLFDKDCILPLLKSLEIIVVAKSEGRNKYDDVLVYLIETCFNYAIYGYNSPTPNNKNSLFERFEKISAPKKFCDLFTILKQLSDSSEKTNKSLNYLSLCVCFLFRGLKPPVFCGAVLSHCDELRKLPSPPEESDELDFPSCAEEAWNAMKEPTKVLNEWKYSDNK
jgi:hypothetical protein